MSARPRLPFTMPGMTVGLFGGSFNPPHEGHAHVAELALTELGLDRIWWLVTPGNPLKDARQLPPIAERVAAVRRIARHPRAIVTDIEARLKTRYTIDLIRSLTVRLPHVHFVLVIGADNWATFHRWGGWREIAGRCAIAVIDRPGATLKALSSPASRALQRHRVDRSAAVRLTKRRLPAWVFIAGRRLKVSSTALRAQRG